MVILLTLGLNACDNEKKLMSEKIDPRAIVTAPPGVPDDADTDLYTIRGMTGLIERATNSW
jgi:hypothetical protein